ncbi:hypothetical protein JOC86_002100 [Bacillus pakistanensis]|uniref:Gas vesicle protein GvpU n=1 Tax=Rossellomorea pakistanensis TaxID=992288 RepID=A0ABS2NCH4_9BACI|nr:gas vesicle accessory protein GvpU [Bacillus pakistanensis]MBM7585558.1 hypothetical protein [Bacillus pakistanensis]
MANKKQEQMATDDAVLLMFLSLVEEDGIEIAITLNVDGVVVSGTLIGASAYYEGIKESSKDLQDTTMSKIITKKFTDLMDGYSKQKQEQDTKEDKENSATFIHLKQARYLGTSHSPTTNSSNWWRGRISSIDGFSFDFHD